MDTLVVAQERSNYADWTIGQLARAAGCTVETVRHYERIGLLASPRRSDGGYRLYGPEDVRRLSFVRGCRNLGFSQVQIRNLLDVIEAPEDGVAEMAQAVRHRLSEVRESLSELKRIEGILVAVEADFAVHPATACKRFEAMLSGDPELVEPRRAA